MSDPTANAIHKGGCLCGAVRYEIKGAPMMSGLCYCQMCQKLSGSGHSVFAVFPESGFRIAGAAKGFVWTADSGNTVATEFCPTCGSPLFGRNSGFPGMIGIRVASLDHSSAFEPQMAVYTKRRRCETRFPETPRRRNVRSR